MFIRFRSLLLQEIGELFYWSVNVFDAYAPNAKTSLSMQVYSGVIYSTLV